MTHIVHGARRKIDLKNEAIRLNKSLTPLKEISFEDPDAVPASEGPFTLKGYEGTLASMPTSTQLVCTNHPLRTWFATVTRRADGKWIIK